MHHFAVFLEKWRNTWIILPELRFMVKEFCTTFLL